MAEATAMADDISDTSHCLDHPYRTLNPGAICPLCLQDKLGKLVSSSSSTSPFPLSPSSSSSFRSSIDTAIAAKPPCIPPPSTLKKTTNDPNNAPPPPLHKTNSTVSAESPRKKTFWSFLYSSPAGNSNRRSTSDVSNSQRGAVMAVDPLESPTAATPGSNASFGQKVGRSRSVGCGSRSFSGDFLERISTGFGDCTLRRVESHRESKPKIVDHHHHRRGKERIKCGGIFGGFGMSSSNMLEAPAEEAEVSKGGNSSAGRNRSWGWTLASPMRAFRPVSSSSSIKHGPVNGGNISESINGGNGRHSVVGNGCELVDKRSFLAG